MQDAFYYCLGRYHGSFRVFRASGRRGVLRRGGCGDCGLHDGGMLDEHRPGFGGGAHRHVVEPRIGYPGFSVFSPDSRCLVDRGFCSVRGGCESAEWSEAEVGSDRSTV